MVDLSVLDRLAEKLGRVTSYTAKCNNETSQDHSISTACDPCYTVTPVTRVFDSKGKNICENSPLGEWQDIDKAAFFEERAAILEYDSGLSRNEAEQRARIETEQEETRRKLAMRVSGAIDSDPQTEASEG